MEDKLKIKGNSIILKVNSKVYPLEVIYSAAYVFLDKAYILLDGEPKKEVLVRLTPKKKEDLEKLGKEFFNELINYADYKKRSEDTKQIREILLQRALITNDPSIIQDTNEKDEFDDTLEDLEDDDFLEDPEGIAIPWEEKYGSKKNEDKAKQ